MADYRELFLQDSIDKQMTIIGDDGTVITNTELHGEAFELTETLCSEENLRFGACEASSIKFKISYVRKAMKDIWLTVNFTIGENEPYQVGRYKVFSDVPTANREFREITAYDAMYDIINAEVSSWYNTVLPTVKYTVTLKQFRDSFFQHFGIQQESVVLPLDTMVVEKTIDPSELSGKTVINAICELNGCFGHIGRNGKFQYIFLEEMGEGLYPSDELFPADDLFPASARGGERINNSYYTSADYEDYHVEKIDKVQIRKEENDIGAIVGNGTNAYIVQDNFLVYGKSANDLRSIAQSLYTTIHSISYRPASVEAVGNPCFEVGKGIRLSSNSDIILTYILQRTLKGIQALSDSYTSTGEQYRQEKVNSVNDSIIQLKGKTNTLVRTIEETKLTVADVERGLSSQITQNAEQIRLRVEKGKIVSEINQTAEAIKIQASKIDLVGLVNAREFTTKYATIETLNANSASLQNLIATKASIDQLNATNASLQNLNATKASIEQLNATSVTLQNLIATKASISDLNATNVAIQNLDANKASLTYVNALNVVVADLVADHVSVNELNAVDAKFQNLNASNITTGTLNASRITSATVVGKLSGQDVVCSNLSADNKVTTPEVNANNILRCPTNFIFKGKAVVTRTINIGGVQSDFLVLQQS